MRVRAGGCSTGEERYSLLLLYERRVRPALARGLGRAPPALECRGTDLRPENVARAGDGGRSWTAAALRTVPPDVLKADFAAHRADAKRSPRHLARQWRLRDPGLVARVDLEEEDVAALSSPSEPSYSYDVILCRYSAFLYCDREALKRASERIQRRLAPGGILVLGATDQMTRDGPFAQIPGSANAFVDRGGPPLSVYTEPLLNLPTLDGFCKAAGVKRPGVPDPEDAVRPFRASKQSEAVLRACQQAVARRASDRDARLKREARDLAAAEAASRRSKRTTDGKSRCAANAHRMA